MPRMVVPAPDKTGKNNCRSPGILSVADHQRLISEIVNIDLIEDSLEVPLVNVFLSLLYISINWIVHAAWAPLVVGWVSGHRMVTIKYCKSGQNCKYRPDSKADDVSEEKVEQGQKYQETKNRQPTVETGLVETDTPFLV